MSNIYILHDISFGYFTSFLDILIILALFLGIFIIMRLEKVYNFLFHPLSERDIPDCLSQLSCRNSD